MTLPPGAADPPMEPRKRAVVGSDRITGGPIARAEIRAMAAWYRELARDIRRRRDDVVAEYDERVRVAEEQAALWERASEAVGPPEEG